MPGQARRLQRSDDIQRMSSNVRKARHSVSQSRRRQAPARVTPPAPSAGLDPLSSPRDLKARPALAAQSATRTLSLRAIEGVGARGLQPAAAHIRLSGRARRSWLAGLRGALARLVAALAAGVRGVFYRLSM